MLSSSLDRPSVICGTLGRFSAFSLPTRDPVHPLKRIGSLVSVGGHLTPSSIYNVTLGFGRVNPFCLIDELKLGSE